MSKKTIITIFGALVSIVILLPLPASIINPIIFTLGIATIFFTRIRF